MRHYLRFVDGFWTMIADGLLAIGFRRAALKLRAWNLHHFMVSSDAELRAMQASTELRELSDDELENALDAIAAEFENTDRRMREAIHREWKRRRRELRDRIRASLMNMDWHREPTIKQLRAALMALGAR